MVNKMKLPPTPSEHHRSHFLFIFFREAAGYFLSITELPTNASLDIYTPAPTHYLEKYVQDICFLLK